MGGSLIVFALEGSLSVAPYMMCVVLGLCWHLIIYFV